MHILFAVTEFEEFNSELLPVYLIFTGSLFLGALVIGKFSLKFGVPSILGILLLGLCINIQIFQIQHGSVDVLHILSLSILLFVAGLKTNLNAISKFLKFGLLLSIGGVVLSSTILGLIIWFFSSNTGGDISLGFQDAMPVGAAMIIAACLSPTDAGATLSVLDKIRNFVPERLRKLLEFESTVNDPSATLYFGFILGLFVLSGTQNLGVSATVDREISNFVVAISTGIILGGLFGLFARFILDKIVDERSQLLIATISIAFIVYGVAEHFRGSGLIAVYVTGLYLENTKTEDSIIEDLDIQEVLEPFNMMTEILVFLLFGLIVDPHDLIDTLPISIFVALGLMLVARPLSVLAVFPFSPFNIKETLLISWCGLRGAVPLALGYQAVEAIPHLRGIDPAIAEGLSVNATSIVFNVIVLNLLIQGLTLRRLSVNLRLDPPDPVRG